jgi:hypothetical protein
MVYPLGGAANGCQEVQYVEVFDVEVHQHVLEAVDGYP